jgi:very-short-patch-repair endonuclease
MALRIHKVRGAHARQMRSEPTEAEKRLWRHLSNAQLGGFKFRRQTVIGTYICDFSCSHNGLVVEIDGDTHDDDADLIRDQQLNAMGYYVIRFSNQDVMRNMDGVLTRILAKAQELPERRYTPTSLPGGLPPATHQAALPPLEGRGF